MVCQHKLRSCISRATKGAGAEMRGLKSPLQPDVSVEKIQDALKTAQDGQGRRWHRRCPGNPRAGTAVLRPPPAATEQGDAGRIQAFPNPEPSSSFSVLLHRSIFIGLHVDPGSPQVLPICPRVWSCCCSKPFWPCEKPTGTEGHFWKWLWHNDSVVPCHGFLHWKRKG